MTDAGVAALSKSPRLSFLNLSYTKVTKASVITLAKMDALKPSGIAQNRPMKIV